jgi:hypothetical protein
MECFRVLDESPTTPMGDESHERRRGQADWGADWGAAGGGTAQRRGRCCASAKDVLAKSSSERWHLRIMPKSFDSLFEELHGLPSGSGPLKCCKPRLTLEEAERKLDKLMSVIAEVSTFRGEALKNRVLAAHPPNRSDPDDESIASSPLAAAAIVELFTDIARNSPVFAPIVLGSSLETSEEVLELMKNIRSVVETVQRCRGLWQYV